jgi:hypothetical protein
MAVIGTALANSSAAPGPWCDVGTAAFATAITLTASAVTAATLILPAQGEGSNFNPLLPIAAMFPLNNSSGYGIQNSTNNGMPASCGVGSVTCATASPSTVTINFVNCGSAATLTAGSRMVLMQATGN